VFASTTTISLFSFSPNLQQQRAISERILTTSVELYTSNRIKRPLCEKCNHRLALFSKLSKRVAQLNESLMGSKSESNILVVVLVAPQISLLAYFKYSWSKHYAFFAAKTT